MASGKNKTNQNLEPKMNLKPIIDQIINPMAPREGVAGGMPFAEYLSSAGISPHAAKEADVEHSLFGKAHGHPLRLLTDLWAESEIAAGRIPPGYDEPKTSKNDDFAIGSIYHHLLLDDPAQFHREFAVVDQELRAELLELAKYRHLADAPKEYSGRLKEAQEFVKANGRKPDENEQALILRQARDRYCEGVKIHSQSPELIAWCAEQESAGKSVIWPKQYEAAQAMVQALRDCPANAGVADWLDGLGPRSCEQSMFAQLEKRDGTRIQLKGRPDMIPHQQKFFLDPKTAISAWPDEFAKSVDKFGYHYQAGGYCLISELLVDHPDPIIAQQAAELGFPKEEFLFLVQEKRPPFLAKVYSLPKDWIKLGRIRFLDACRSIADVASTGKWPGYGNGAYEGATGPVEELAPPFWLEKTLENL